MKVRPLTPADAVAFRYVRLEALERHPGAYGSTLADWQGLPLSAYVRRIEDGVIFGLWTDRGLEGLLAYDRDKGGNARHRASLHAVYVRDTLRGQGAGEALLDAAVERATADGVRQLELTVAEDNDGAIAFYARHGFEEYARLPRALYVDGAFVDEIAMVRRLD
ncbi:GNAT family N-acetyltransferase [Wenxinia marina]|uniref:Sortase n=1 Tax=Wenxinia marina DSM 24838 TaxID=1123501 RepID=A0A0D0QCN2_9RHOB|nr:GNAT family N-acetyltransferase [Wenxinia marina]KIQ70087.1 Sortase [Wenxinia marina DSM 24838]GGL63380.1 N-acetyltransferase [Wenxinia marina]